MNERDSWTVDAMDKSGGSFVQALATLARRADPINLQKIKYSWPEYWRSYEELGKLMESKDHE